MDEPNQMKEGPPVSLQAGQEEIGAGLRENLQGAPPSAEEVLGQTKERLRTFKRDTDNYVRRNPAKAVFTALGIGFVLGLMRRR